jgi:predicted  nucleic acid-binding Zn-ribbon protein
MSAAEAAKIEMEDARAAVVDCEREIQAIKAKLQTLRSAASAEAGEAAELPNSLEIALLKVS